MAPHHDQVCLFVDYKLLNYYSLKHIIMDYTKLVMPSLFSPTNADFGPSDFFSNPFDEEDANIESITGSVALPSNTLHSKLHSPRSKQKPSEANKSNDAAPPPARKRRSQSAPRKALPPISITACDESVSTMSSGAGGGDPASENGPPVRKRAKKNVKGKLRQRARSRREVATEIEQKPESERTANEREWLAHYIEQREKKNARSRERALARSAEMARIEAIAPFKRTPEENQWYALQCKAKKAKNEADRERRAQKKAQLYPDGEPPKRIEYEYLLKVKAEAYGDGDSGQRMDDGGISPFGY